MIRSFDDQGKTRLFGANLMPLAGCLPDAVLCQPLSQRADRRTISRSESLNSPSGKTRIIEPMRGPRDCSVRTDSANAGPDSSCE